MVDVGVPQNKLSDTLPLEVSEKAKRESGAAVSSWGSIVRPTAVESVTY